MFRFLAAAFLLAAMPVRADEGVPKLDVQGTCNAVTPAEAQNKSPQQACMNDEQQAETTLRQKWSTYPAALRDRCVRETTIGGYPSYVEVLTCIQVASGAEPVKGETSYRRPHR